MIEKVHHTHDISFTECLNCPRVQPDMNQAGQGPVMVGMSRSGR